METKDREALKWQTILECSNLGSWEWNIESGETVFNETWAEMVGYTLEELAPVSIRTWESLAHPDDLKASNELLERHFSGELPYYDFESRMRHKDGHWVWVHDRGKVVLRSADGKPLLMVGSHEDISKQKAAELSLQESNRFFSGIFHSIPIGIAIVDPETQRFLRVNQGFLDIVEYTEEEVVQKTVADLTHPEDWEREKVAIAARLSGTATDYVSEKRYIAKSGKIRHVILNGNLLQSSNGGFLAVANVVDVTEKKLSDRRIEHLNKVLLAVRNVNQLITKEKDLGRLLQKSCDNLIETRGYHSVWLALLDEHRKIEAVSEAGLREKFVALKTALKDDVRLRCVESCLETPGVLVVLSPPMDCGACPLVDRYPGLSAMSVRLEYGNTLYGLMTVSVPEDLAHDAQEQALLQEVADDISFAIHNLEVEEKEKALAEMLDIAPSSITIHNKDGNFLYANRKTAELHGYTPDEFIQIHLSALDVPESNELFAARVREIEELGEAHFDVRHYRKDGTSFPLAIYAKKITWKNQPAILSIATDITERLEAQKKIAAERNQLLSIFDSIDEPMYVADPKTYELLFANRALKNRLGKYPIGWLCYSALQGLDSPCAFCTNSIIEQRAPEPYQWEHYNAALDRSYVIYDRMIKWSDGRDVRLELAIDITERKKAEEALAAEKERLAVTLQSIGDGVISVDTKGKVVLLNRAAEEMTGWTSPEAEGRPLDEIFQIVNEITREPCENPVTRVLASGEVVELANHTSLLSRDRREIVIADSAAPIRTQTNKTIGVVLVFRDMTEKRKMETAIEVSSKLESLGILAGGIAHDFNNLLGGIYGYVDMAYASAEEEDNVRQYLSITMATIERARALTQQLLTFAKGGAPIQKVSPLFPFVKEVAQFALSGADIACNFDIPKGLWSCNYDSNQLGQVVDNLVINAKQAMPIGGTITVSAHNTAILKKEHPVLDDGDYVQLSIRDTGIGIQKDLLSRIFDPFFTTKSKGHGLGLATCYSIVNRHGGCIEVDSDPGKGTAFHIYLPAVKESDVAAEQQKTATHRGTGTILVMDDEEVMRDMICAMLASFGYRAVCKENGKEAVRYVEAVLKDSQMLSGMIFDLTVPGGMGGKEAIAAIREFNTEIPAFVASGYANDPVMRNPVQYGFTASIGKPFKRTELGEMLAKHVKASFSAEKKPHPVDGSPPSSTADSPETAP